MRIFIIAISFAALLPGCVTLIETSPPVVTPSVLPPANPLVLRYPGRIDTLDGNGKRVGYVQNVVLTLTRHILQDGQLTTNVLLTYQYDNGDLDGTSGGKQKFSIDGTNDSGTVIAPNMVDVDLPRYQCWYGGRQHTATIHYGYYQNGITGISPRIGIVQGQETGC